VVLVCLPCSSLQACESWLVSGGDWNRWSSPSCSPVLAVLAVFLPWYSLSMEWLGFAGEKLIFGPLLALLVDSTAWLFW
jgi:hypothetical protein